MALAGIFNQNKAAMVLKSHDHGPERGPAVRDDNRGTLTLSLVLVSGNSAEKALELLRQLISQSRKSPGLVGEIKHRLGPVSEPDDVGVIGAPTAL